MDTQAASEAAPSRNASERRRVLGSSAWLTVPGTFAILAGGYAAMPPLDGAGDAAGRIVLAVRWLLVAFLPYAAVCLHILYQRFAEGAHNPLAHTATENLQIHCRVMQNTLEQLVWFAICILALATWLSPAQARFIPVACVFFAFARLVYWWGYLRNGTLGRGPAVQMTFTLNVSLMLGAIVQSVRGMMG
ncbi:MAPEG family protein [Ramlibacter albus]|uniref:MAPEG family protein n=1 Tax=Ramlibacter albus TaxID=2079448 RepID=A0A923M9K3_9BURK|nr:MAPEG family protein [Ramlibacter albus]MBC5766530.1 MAPEG family protein [Ramlibacter albus]